MHHKIQGVNIALQLPRIQQILVFSTLTEILTCVKSPSISHTNYLITIHPMIYLLTIILGEIPFQRMSQELQDPKGQKS